MKTLTISVQDDILDTILALLKTLPNETYNVEEIYDFERELAHLE